MTKRNTEPNADQPSQETAVSPEINLEEKLAALFDEAWSHYINQRWQQAETLFAQIESHNSHYEQKGLQVSHLRRKAQFERQALAALDAGALEEALTAFQQADDFENAHEVYELLTIQELEARAEEATSIAHYQQAAWIYDHLLHEYPEHEREHSWQIKKESCWEAELLPYFLIGQKALENHQWRTAYKAFAQVLAIDPYFRKDNHSAAALAEVARKEVVLLADQLLRQGKTQEALDAYREIGHLARIENVDEFLRLRHREEEVARQLEQEGKWQEAAAKYSYLCTLYYDEDGRSQWQEAADRCLENGKIKSWYEQALSAFNQKQWREAAALLGQIIALRPSYQPGEHSIAKLYRTARWRSITSQFNSQNNGTSPQIGTGNAS